MGGNAAGAHILDGLPLDVVFVGGFALDADIVPMLEFEAVARLVEDVIGGVGASQTQRAAVIAHNAALGWQATVGDVGHAAGGVAVDAQGPRCAGADGSRRIEDGDDGDRGDADGDGGDDGRVSPSCQSDL